MGSISGAGDAQAGITKKQKRERGASGRMTDLVSQSARRERWNTYLYVAAITGILVIILFLTRQIYPFGDKVIRYLDGAQYFGILSYVQNTFFTDNDLLFSWGAILGGNMIGTLAYYASSPFNLLVVLFPNDLMLGYHIIFIIKFIAAAVCFAVMLEHIFGEADPKAVILMAVSYPFMGYMTYFAWNQSWMDGVIFLPLIVLGIWRLVTVSQPLLYTIMLALMLLSNYYIAYMVCIASVLVFVCILILRAGSLSRKQVMKCTGWFAAGSVLAVALAAVLLLPAYVSLPENRTQDTADILKNITYLSRPDEILSMLFTGPYSGMEQKANSPVIYTGIVQLVLAVLFFLNGEIPKRWKAVAAGLLIIFAASFMVSVLNIAWHAFTVNVWFNFRYSFLVSFVLEVMAYCAFVHIRGAKGKMLAAGAVLAVIAALAVSGDRENVRAGTFALDILWICGSLGLLYWYAADGNAAKKFICYALLACLTFGNLVENGYLSIEEMREAKTYYEALEVDQEIRDTADDDSFYRMGSTWRYGANNPMRSGYAGVENFASTENTEAVEMVRRLGLGTGAWQSWYDGNVPIATDALLGLKYIITNDTFKSRYYEDRGRIADDHLSVLENKYALPVLFPSEEIFMSDGDLSKFAYINSYWNAVSAAGGDVLTALDYTSSQRETADGTDYTLSFAAPGDGPVYAYIPKGEVTPDVPISPEEDLDVFFVGDFTAGEAGKLVLHAGKSYKAVSGVLLYQENIGVLKQKVAAAARSDLEIALETSSHLRVWYAPDKDGILASTIPFDEGWHVYVDGEEVETYRNMDSFLAFDVPAGMHDIELIYRPPYLDAGTAISLSALAILILYVVWQYRRRKPSKSPMRAENKEKIGAQTA